MTRVSTVRILFAMVLVTTRAGYAQDATPPTPERTTPFDGPNPFSEGDLVPAPLPGGPADPAEVLLSKPPGLTMPVDDLLQRLGHNPLGSMNGIPYPFTPETCVTLSHEAVRAGLYRDAIALTECALKQESLSTTLAQRNTLLYLKAVSELAVGRRKSCIATMRTLAAELNLTPGADGDDVLRELQSLSPKVNGPIVIRFRYAFQALVRTNHVPTESLLN